MLHHVIKPSRSFNTLRRIAPAQSGTWRDARSFCGGIDGEWTCKDVLDYGSHAHPVPEAQIITGIVCVQNTYRSRIETMMPSIAQFRCCSAPAK
jgi:hypothetical protein